MSMSQTCPETGPGAPQETAAGWPTGSGPPDRREALHDALTHAAVELGDRDERIVGWLAGWEPSTVDTIIGWITQANVMAASAPAHPHAYMYEAYGMVQPVDTKSGRHAQLPAWAEPVRSRILALIGDNPGDGPAEIAYVVGQVQLESDRSTSEIMDVIIELINDGRVVPARGWCKRGRR